MTSITSPRLNPNGDIGAPPHAGIVVPVEVRQIAEETLGAFFEPISKLPASTTAADFLDLAKCFKRAAILSRYSGLESKKVLEVGSGFGTNLAVWSRAFGADAHGVEPGGEGFNHGYRASRLLLAANGIEPERVTDAAGENLPFADGSFDIVYSANVLEHTQDPARVLAEALRVLRPGGVLHMEFPNYLAYFEGHYMVVQPPILWRSLLPWWIGTVIRRDPAFARTIQTLNPIWVRRTLKTLRAKYVFEVVTLGEDLFLERLTQAFQFETKAVASRIEGLIRIIQKINRGNWIGRLLVAAQAHYPIYLTLRKAAAQPARSS